MRLFEEPEADGAPQDDVPQDGGVPAVDGASSSSAPPPPPPPPPPPEPMHPPNHAAMMPPEPMNPPNHAAMMPPEPMNPPNHAAMPSEPMHPPPQDAVMPLGQDFFYCFKGLPFFAGLCVFTASSNEVGTDDRCWHCSQCAKDDFEPQASASALYDDPLALLDFFLAAPFLEHVFIGW